MTDISLTEDLLTEFGFLKKSKAKMLTTKYLNNFKDMPDDAKKYVETNAPNLYAVLMFRFYRDHYTEYTITPAEAKFIDANLDNYWSDYLLNRFNSNFPTSVLSIRPYDMKYLANSQDNEVKTKYFVTIFNVLKHSPETILAKSPNDSNLVIAQKRMLNDDAAKERGGTFYNQTVDYYRSRNQFEIDPRYDMSKLGKAPPAKAVPKSAAAGGPLVKGKPPATGAPQPAQTASPAAPPVAKNFSATNKKKDHDINRQNNEALKHKIVDEIISDPGNFFFGSEDDKRISKNIAFDIVQKAEKYSGYLEYFDAWLNDGHKKSRTQMDQMREHMSDLVKKWLQ